MAPSKRKAQDDSILTSSKKANTKTPSTAAPASATVKTTVKKDEEAAFPRGGGSVLTPLEHKQISIEAKRDALFEEESGTKPSKKDDKESKKRKRKSKEKDAVKPVRDEDAVKIEGLNYKVYQILEHACTGQDADHSLAPRQGIAGPRPSLRNQ